MSLIVRPSQIDDIGAILSIKSEPQVARNQYSVDVTGYSEMLQRVLGGDNRTGIVTTQFSTIDKDNESIGYVRHDHYEVNSTRMVSCAWNLMSNYWGQGVMKESLTRLLDEWILGLKIHHVFADHFRGNVRCRRLLDSLAFISQEIPMLERLTCAYQQHCLHWVVRRRLDADTWKRISRLPVINPIN